MRFNYSKYEDGDFRIRSVKELVKQGKKVLKLIKSSLTLDDFETSSTFVIFNFYLYRFEQILNDPYGFYTKTEEDVEEMKSIFLQFYKKLDFTDAKIDSKVIEFLERIGVKQIISDNAYDSLELTVKNEISHTITTEYDEQVPLEWLDKRTAFILAKILIERKELTLDSYLMLAPHLYPSPYHRKELDYLPIIHFSDFENDYEWSKGNASNIALTLSIENAIGNDYIEEVFGIQLKRDDDDDDGDNPSSSLVDA